MPITPNAAPDEYNSSFFIKNKVICEEFDSIINNLGGETRGAYNAWSYHAIGNINHLKEWQFSIKKSTYSSGNLLLSSKYNNLHIASEWACKNFVSKYSKFLIKKRGMAESFKTFTHENWSKLPGFNSYVINGESPTNTLALKLTKLLRDLLTKQQVFSIKYNNPILIIDLRTDELHKNLITQLITF